MQPVDEALPGEGRATQRRWLDLGADDRREVRFERVVLGRGKRAWRWHGRVVGRCQRIVGVRDVLGARRIGHLGDDRGRADHAGMMLAGPYQSVTGFGPPLLITAPNRTYVPSYSKCSLSSTRYSTTSPFSTRAEVLTTSTSRMLRTVRAAVATAMRAASLHDLGLVPTSSRMMTTPISLPPSWSASVRVRAAEPNAGCGRQPAMPRRLTLIVFALVTLLAACNGGPGASPSPTIPPSPTPAPTPTPSPTLAPNHIN